MFLDGSVLEVFANETTALTARIYQIPTGPLQAETRRRRRTNVARPLANDSDFERPPNRFALRVTSTGTLRFPPPEARPKIAGRFNAG